MCQEKSTVTEVVKKHAKGVPLQLLACHSLRARLGLLIYIREDRAIIIMRFPTVCLDVARLLGRTAIEAKACFDFQYRNLNAWTFHSNSVYYSCEEYHI